MSTESDRRAPYATRIPFDAMVEVGGALGPAFEARAVNLSEEGMQLRTAYLPEIGQPVTCRFDAGPGLTVLAAGEVLWKEDLGSGGEFGIRFTNLDSPSVVALQRILGMAGEADGFGRKVRLHIEGLASPMRARVKSSDGANVTAFSDLGFLQVGKHLDLEDAMTGTKRPALLDRVEIEIEKESRIPQLIVTLRYDDEEARVAEMMGPIVDETTGRDENMHDDHAKDEAHAASAVDADDSADPGEHAPSQDEGAAGMPGAATASAKATIESDDESKKLKSAFARSALKARADATVAFEKLAKRAKTTIALVAARAKKTREDAEIPLRRTTAPPPGGALHAAGRKVVRGDINEDRSFGEDANKPRFKITKKKIVVASAIGAATVLAAIAMHKPSPAPVAVNAANPASTTTLNAANATNAASPETAGLGAMPGAAARSPGMPGAQGMSPMQVGSPGALPNDPFAASASGAGATGAVAANDDGPTPGHHGKIPPFGNGPVGSHGNVLKIKMDGAIDKIQGASQPTGFTVVIPNRKSLDAAGPLAAKDPRIAAIRVANETSGAELTVTFKDGVPNYQVRAKGDTLEMVLARPTGPADKAADAHAGHGKRHKKH